MIPDSNYMLLKFVYIIKSAHHSSVRIAYVVCMLLVAFFSSYSNHGYNVYIKPFDKALDSQMGVAIHSLRQNKVKRIQIEAKYA